MSKEESLDYMKKTLSEISNSKVYINISQTAKALGVTRGTVAKEFAHLKWKQNGREKLFLIPDVAEAIYNSMEGGF